MKIQDKFLVGFLVSSLLSILAIWVCLDLAQTAMRQSAIQNIAMQTNIAMGRIDQRLRQNLHWVECCAAHLASTAHLPVSGDAQTSGHSPDSPIGPSSLQQALSALSDRLRAEIQAKTVRDGNGAVDRFERIFAIDRDGMLIAATNEEADYPPWSNPSWWHKTRETGGCIQTVSSTAGAGEDEIVFAAAMRDSAGGFTGAIVYMMSASRTAALLERLREDFPCESVTLTLLDDRDAVICQASDVEAIRQELFPARRTKSELTSRPTKERQTQAHCEIDAYAISDSQAGQQCVGWHLRCDYDPQEVFRAASTFRRKAVAPALAFALIGLTLGLFMSRSITEPIHRLATAAKSISHGNLNGVVLVDSNDETRNLSECLHEMIDRLKSTIHDLEGEVGHRRDAEEQLAQINRTLIETVAELERGNRELQDVAYAAAHDLKTPLRGIATIAQWMVNDHGDTLPEPVREQIGLLHMRALRANRLVDGLQEYASSGHNLARPKELDVGDLLRAVLADIENPKHVAIEIADPMPVVVADEVSLYKVFTHLIGNAIEHMDKPDGLVRVDWQDDDARWRFHISDNGPGIAPQYHAKVFQMFQTLATRDETNTVGIGLCIAKKTVEAYGGTICIRSKVGRGTTFSFTWPKSPKVGSTLEQLVCHLPEPAVTDAHDAA